MRCLIILLWLSITTLLPLQAQWQKLPGLEGGKIYDMERIDGVLWAGTHTGVFRSFDDGESWERYDFFPRNRDITIIEELDGEIFLLLIEPSSSNFEHEILYRSQDGGNTWTSAELNVDFQGLLGNTFEFFKMGGYYFIQDGPHLFRSLNGQTWESLLNNYPQQQTYYVRIKNDGQRLLMTDFDTKRIFVSEDYGDSWQQTGERDIFTNFFFEGDRILYNNTYDSIFVSNDLGQTWTGTAATMPLGPNDYDVQYKRGRLSGLLYAYDRKLYVSDDNGLTWETAVPLNDHIEAFFETEEGEFVIASNREFYRTTEQGQQPQLSNSGFEQLRITHLFTAPWGELYAHTRRGLLRTIDDGQHWNSWSSPNYTSSFESVAWIGDTAFLLHGWNVYRSTDSLQTYEYEPLNPEPLDWFAIEDGIFYGLFSDEFYVSADTGSTWSSSEIPFHFSPYHSDILLKEGVILMADDKKIYRSVDQGATWEETFSDFNAIRFKFVEFSDQILIESISAWHSSSDLGLSWQEVTPVGLPKKYDSDPAPDVISTFAIDSIAFAAIHNGKIYASNDRGRNWQWIGEGNGNVRGRKFAYANGALYFGTYRDGLWKATLDLPSQTTAQPAPEAAMQISPNPSRYGTPIRMKLPASPSGQGLLSIYRSDGSRLHQYAVDVIAGTLQLPSGKLPAGQYVLSLLVNGNRYAGQAIVVD